MIASTDDLLGVLKYALLALLYLFFARVLWAVWSEVRVPRQANRRANSPAGMPGVPPMMTPGDPTMPTGSVLVTPPPAATPPRSKARRGRRGRVARLVITEPRERRGSAYAVGAEITVGRAPTCTIPVPDDAFASQLHARVMLNDTTVVLEDLGSTNGTYLNGRRIVGPEALTVGDRIQIGRTMFEAD